ncbi:hypothetical protein TL16_g09179 [Triparma laevis f. inornata]|uniref:Dynein light chain n=2 Tax=Triparma laevis TaxID=1534972 RepID=A0A9W7AB13_9STRA|nr:hypothetical protein TrLO_g5207 [Triparma laevis f. longispina]GMH82198.1 hypothetical protein TL16_g09179 [Triparma laevis f. inornata]
MSTKAVIEPPSYHMKASKRRMEEIIKEVQQENLGDNWKYTSDDATNFTKKISDDVKNRLRDLGLPRYKFMVQVTLGQKVGEGMHMGMRCLWDQDTDAFATVIHGSDDYFCSVTAYGVYQY